MDLKVCSLNARGLGDRLKRRETLNCGELSNTTNLMAYLGLRIAFKQEQETRILLFDRHTFSLGGLLSTQEARVALGYRLVRLLPFSQALQSPECIHNSIIHAMAFTIC